MRTGFREIPRNFSNSANNDGFRDCGFRGIAENRQPSHNKRRGWVPTCPGDSSQSPLPQFPLRKIWQKQLILFLFLFTLNCTQSLNEGETPWMSYDATDLLIWHHGHWCSYWPVCHHYSTDTWLFFNMNMCNSQFL